MKTHLLLALTTACAAVMPLAALAQTAEPAPTASTQRTDSRGYINPWLLRTQILDIVARPAGQEECSSEEGDEDTESAPTFRTKNAQLAFERKLKEQQRAAANASLQCRRTQQKLQNQYASALLRLNRDWLPLLQKASNLGDPVAEFILRSCKATSLLDRKGVASDCSENEADRRYARDRIEAIGFKPALYDRTVTAHADFLRETNDACGRHYSGDKPNVCAYQNDIERYRRILSIMRTGYFGVVEHYNTCQMRGPTEELDRMVEECQRLMILMTGISGQTGRFYLNLSLDHRPLNGADNLHNALDITIDRRRPLTRNDWSKFSDPAFDTNFYRELEQVTREIQSDIFTQLRKEPRWAVFLAVQQNGRIYDAAPDDARE